MNNKSIRNAVLTGFALACLGLTSAHAGEVTGTGKSLKDADGLNGASECAYSGLQDAPFDPGTTQSWGSIPKAVRDAMRAALLLIGIDILPGTSCNPHRSSES